MTGTVLLFTAILFWLGGCLYLSWPRRPDDSMLTVTELVEQLHDPVLTGTDRCGKPLLAGEQLKALEAEAFAPVDIAAAERKAIAQHAPLELLDLTVPVIQPPVRHPHDPCYLPGCPQARSQHEHAEVIGVGPRIIETAAFGGRDRSFIPGPPVSAGGGPPVQVISLEPKAVMRRRLRREAGDLMSKSHRTSREEALLAETIAQLDALHRRMH